MVILVKVEKGVKVLVFFLLDLFSFFPRERGVKKPERRVLVFFPREKTEEARKKKGAMKKKKGNQ